MLRLVVLITAALLLCAPPVDAETSHRVAYEEAVERAAAAEKAGRWTEALDAWTVAHEHAERAWMGAEFGTKKTMMGFGPNSFEMDMPTGFEHVRDAEQAAIRTADRAGDSEAALRWAKLRTEIVESLEAKARSEGRTEQADAYLLQLKSIAITRAGEELRHRDLVRRRLLTILATVELGLLFGFVGAFERWRRRRRPRFVYWKQAHVSRAIPWAAVVGLVAAGCVTLGFAAWMLDLAVERPTRDAMGFYVVLSLASAFVAVPAFGAAVGRIVRRNHATRSLAQADWGTPEELVALCEWFEANAHELERDFADWEEELPGPGVVNDGVREALFAWLGPRIGMLPEWLDTGIVTSVREGSWAIFGERLLSSYLEAIGAERAAAILGTFPASARAIFTPVEDIDAEPVLQGYGDWLAFEMRLRRRWSLAGWRRRFLDDPAVSELCSSVVWGAFDAGMLVASFRLDGEGALLGPGFETISIDALAGRSVGVAHPSELGGQLVRRWEREIAEFEVQELFRQLDGALAEEGAFR